MRLKGNDFDEHIKKVDPDFFEREGLKSSRRAERQSRRSQNRIPRESTHKKSKTNSLSYNKYYGTRAVRHSITLTEADVQMAEEQLPEIAEDIEYE